MRFEAFAGVARYCYHFNEKNNISSTITVGVFDQLFRAHTHLLRAHNLRSI